MIQKRKTGRVEILFPVIVFYFLVSVSRFLAFCVWLFACLLALLHCGGVGVDAVFVYTDVYVVAYLYCYGCVVNGFYFAVDASACYYILSCLKSATEVVNLFLAFALGTNHHEVHDCYNDYKHE